MSTNLSWLDEEILLQTSNDLIEATPMSKICVHIWKMNNKQTIDRKRFFVDISANGIIPFSAINNLIKENEYIGETRYRMVEYFMLNIDIATEKCIELSAFNVEHISDIIISKYIKPLQNYQSITVNPSICIFHELNAIFIIMEKLKPILKSTHYTKRARNDNPHNKTAKIIT